MTFTDAVVVWLALNALFGLAVLLEWGWRKLRYVYRVWRVRRLIQQEQRAFEEWLEKSW